MIRRFLNRLFRREDLSLFRGRPYMIRWTLLSLFGHRLYVHHFVGDDWCVWPHDHPCSFVSLMLWGGYVEHIWREWPNMGFVRESVYHAAPRLCFRKAETRHRILMGSHRSAWTLVWMFRNRREWGFWPEGRWAPAPEYIRSELRKGVPLP